MPNVEHYKINKIMKNKILFFRFILATLVFTFLMVGCQESGLIDNKVEKEKSTHFERQQTDKTDGSFKTSKKEVDVNKLETIARIITRMSDNKKALEQIQGCTQLALKNNYDSEIWFKELLNPGNSKFLKQEKRLKSDFFKDAFHKAVKNSGNKIFNLEKYMINHNLSIYWPYSKKFDQLKNPTVTYNPMEKVKSNIGFKLVKEDNGKVSFKKVKVDEEYCLEHPVLVIGPSERYVAPGGGSSGGVGGSGGSGGSGDSGGSGSYHKVQIGYVKCTEQYDWWLAGGSELKFHVARATHMGNGNADDDWDDHETVTVSRYDIKNNNWVHCYQNLIPDWDEDETRRLFTIWERDGGGDVSFSGYVKINVAEYGEIGVEAEKSFNSHEGKFLQHGWERDAFFSNNQINQGHGFKDGWPVHHTASIYWTYPETEY